MNFLTNLLSIVYKAPKNALTQNKNAKQGLSTKKEYRKNLYDSLKQLEFISFFEIYLDNKKEDNYSLTFLEELDKTRKKAKLNTLTSIKNCCINRDDFNSSTLKRYSSTLKIV